MYHTIQRFISAFVAVFSLLWVYKCARFCESRNLTLNAISARIVTFQKVRAKEFGSPLMFLHVYTQIIDNFSNSNYARSRMNRTQIVAVNNRNLRPSVARQCVSISRFYAQLIKEFFQFRFCLILNVQGGPVG